jgi:hypothetical protein
MFLYNLTYFPKSRYFYKHQQLSNNRSYEKTRKFIHKIYICYFSLQILIYYDIIFILLTYFYNMWLCLDK